MAALNQMKEEFSFISDVRGLGLMIGIDVEIAPAEVLSKALSKGLILLTAGEKTIRLLPPLNISDEEVNEAVQIIKESFEEVDNG